MYIEPSLKEVERMIAEHDADAYNMGFEAGKSGESVNKNPMPYSEDPEMADYLRGWQDAGGHPLDLYAEGRVTKRRTSR